MTNFEIPKSPDWTPNSAERRPPIAASEAADFPDRARAVDVQRSDPRPWAMAGAAVAAALLVGAVGGLFGATVLSQHSQSLGVSSSTSTPAGDIEADSAIQED